MSDRNKVLGIASQIIGRDPTWGIPFAIERAEDLIKAIDARYPPDVQDGLEATLHATGEFARREHQKYESLRMSRDLEAERLRAEIAAKNARIGELEAQVVDLFGRIRYLEAHGGKAAREECAVPNR